MRRFVVFVFLAGALLIAMAARPAAAQTGKGTIAGTAVDSAKNVLIGAVIQVSPSGQRAVSDNVGNFRISDVPLGPSTVTVSYVGLADFTGNVVVEAGQTATVNAVLNVASRTDQVMVTAERLEGQAEAVNVERSSDDIVQVLPLKVITSLPNTNIADAVGRVPSVSLERDEGEGKYVQIRGTEPRLNNVTINGVYVPSVEGTVRQIKLDAVPADLVERIEVFKTLSSNQDSDGVGGTVNLVTKTAADKPTIEFGGEGGYTPIQGGRTRGEFDGTLGKRFGAGHKFGFLLGGTWDRNNRGINDAEVPALAVGTDPATGANFGYATNRDYRTYSYYRTRYGFDTGIDYNINSEASVYVRGLFSDFHDYGDVWVYTPFVGNSIKKVNGSVITFYTCTETTAPLPPPGCTPGGENYRHYIRRPDQQLYSILTGARKDSPNWLLIWEAAGSRGHNIGGQDFQTTNFNGPTVDIQVDQSDPLTPKLLPTPTSTVNIYDPALYSVSNSSFNNYIATDVAFQGGFSAARRYSLHSHYGTFDMGFKIRDSHTTQKETDLTYSPCSGCPVSVFPFTLAQVLGTYTNPTYYDKAFLYNGQAYGPTSDYNKIIHAVDANLSSLLPSLVENTISDEITSASAFFDADERIYAAYLMNGISIGKWRFNTGVRFEDTTTGSLANKVTKNQDSMGNALPPTITHITQTTSYFNALPGIQVQYQIQKDTNLRGNFSMGISRPNIQDEVPNQTFDPNTSPRGTITEGNPNLKATRANNYDLLIEHFFQPLGILQGGFFYKQLYNPIYSTAAISGPNFVTTSINGPRAHITGFEMDWEQRFSFLPGLANGLGVAANYSHTASQATFPAGFSCGGKDPVTGAPTLCRTDQPTLQRTAPNTYNIGITYDKARFSMRFAISHNDASIFQYQFVGNTTPNDPVLGLKGPTGDNYLYAHTQYDIQGSYRMYKGLRFIVSGLNLTNEVFGFYNGSPIYPNQREFYKPTVSFGMRWSSAVE